MGSRDPRAQNCFKSPAISDFRVDGHASTKELGDRRSMWLHPVGIPNLVSAHQPWKPDVGQYEKIGSATAAAEYAAVLAAILDSFGGAVTSNSWNKLAGNALESAHGSAAIQHATRLPPGLPIWSLDNATFPTGAASSPASSAPAASPQHVYASADTPAANYSSHSPHYGHLFSEWSQQQTQWQADLPPQLYSQSAPSVHEMQWESQSQQLSVYTPDHSIVPAPADQHAEQPGPLLPDAAEANTTVLRKKKVRRARILKEGSLTLIPYGVDESLQWAERIAQFTHQARCVLGDRAYSKPWGGSVLDSVIGTFLTQNVSDQLSSKAYMTLAARFPARPPIANPGLHLKHSAPLASGLPPELPGHGNADSNCMASSHKADQTTFVHMDKGTANSDDLGMRERQLVVNDVADISDAVNWEAVRRAPASQVAEAIQCRGMHNRLADSIQAFLNRLHSTALAAQQGVASVQPHELDTANSPSQLVTAQPPIDHPMGVTLQPVSQAGPLPCHTHLQDKAHLRADPLDSIDIMTGASPTVQSLQNTCGRAQGEPDASSATAVCAAVEGWTVWRAAADEAADIAATAGNTSQQVELSLEWLRNATPQVASAFLMSVEGLGRKSVACIMLLCLRLQEFPVDVNVGRICSRLGWIPLDSELGIEADQYAPETEVHKYLHSRLASFDIATLYELHYQMITLGKVFCSKVSPNCGACPLQANCEYALNNGKRLQPQAVKPFPAQRQEPGQHRAAECASDARAVSTDMEDLAPATPTKPVAAVLLGSPRTPVGCTPMETAQPTAPVAAAVHAEQASAISGQPAQPTAPLAAVHAEQASANSEQSAEPKPPVCAHAAEDVAAELSTARVGSPSTTNFAGCASAAQSVEHVVEMLLAAGRAMHQAETEASAVEHPDRLLEAAAEALGLHARTGLCGQAPGDIRRRMRELSMVVHPDKCSLASAEEAFAALQHAYSILQRHTQQQAQPPGSHPVAEQAAGTHHNRLLLQAFEIPQSCLHLLPLHLQARAQCTPCNIPFLALPFQPPRASPMVMCGGAPSISHPASTDQPDGPGADAGVPWQPQVFEQGTLAGPACRAGGSDLQNSMPVACRLDIAEFGSQMRTGTTGSPAGTGSCSAGLKFTADIASTAGIEGVPCSKQGSHEQQGGGTESVGRACSPGSSVKDGLAYVALLVPCRKAMKNQFPLNGTFFQVNEVFLDQATITHPMQVPEARMKEWRRRGVYSGVQAASICRGMRQGEVAYLFNQACICVRAYNSTTGMPGVLPAWLLPTSAQVPKPKRASHDKADAPIHKKAKGPSSGMQGTAVPPFAIDQHESDPPNSKTHPAAPGSTQVASTKLMFPTSTSNQTPRISPVHVSAALQGHINVAQAQRQLTAHPKMKQLHGLTSEKRLKSPRPAGNTKSRKRYRPFQPISASQRCGHCRTCQKLSMKKACLTRRAEMEAALAGSQLHA
ncbi:hypothetical protein WJX77_008246 [Trebouxia sp. C0004]